MDCKVEKIFKGSLDSIPLPSPSSTVFSGDAGVARAPPEFGGSEKRQSLISAYRSLAITTNTTGLKKLNTALLYALKIANPYMYYDFPLPELKPAS